MSENRTNAWVEQIFDAEEAATKGVVRRAKRWVHEYGALEALQAAVAARNFRLIELTDQYVVVCDPQPMKITVQ